MDTNSESSSEHTPITTRQQEALELFIMNSEDCGENAKRIIIWLTRKSKFLTEPVTLSLGPEWEELGKTLAYAIHDMNSSNGSTRLDIFCGALNTLFSFHSQSGSYVDGTFNSRTGGTIWISQFSHDHNATVITLNQKEVEDMVVPEWFTDKI